MNETIKNKNGEEIEIWSGFTTAEMINRLYCCEIPKRYWDAKLNEKTDSAKILKNLKDGSGVVIAGTFGCGKTYALCAYMFKEFQENREKQNVAIYISANALYSKLKDRDEGVEFLRRVKWIPVLLIDDLGREYEAESGYFHSLLDEIIDYRYSNYLTTVIATNLSLEDFKNRYSGRILDRMREWGGFYESGEGSLRKSVKRR